MSNRKRVYLLAVILALVPLASYAAGAGATGPLGGFGNTAEGENATEVGGVANNANGNQSVITGGAYNIAGEYCTIAGGYANRAANVAAVVGGGAGNVAADYSVIGGGILNVADSLSAITGGAQNNAARYGAITGGASNVAGQVGFVGGGALNNAGFYGVVVGGAVNQAGEAAFVGGGTLNKATGSASMILGGSRNTAAGAFSTVIGGFRANAATTGSVIIADAQDSDVNTTLTNQMLLRAQNGVNIAGTLGGANDMLGTVGTFYPAIVPVVDVANAPANPALAGTVILNIPQGNVIELNNTAGAQRIISSIQPIRPKGTLITFMLINPASFQIDFRDSGGAPGTPLDLNGDFVLVPDTGIVQLISTGTSYVEVALTNN